MTDEMGVFISDARKVIDQVVADMAQMKLEQIARGWPDQEYLEYIEECETRQRVLDWQGVWLWDADPTYKFVFKEHKYMVTERAIV